MTSEVDFSLFVLSAVRLVRFSVKGFRSSINKGQPNRLAALRLVLRMLARLPSEILEIESHAELKLAVIA